MLGVLVASALSAVACLDRPMCIDCNPVTTNVFVDSVAQRQVNKIDLLFVIDNSRSMADKQQVLSEAVPDLVRRLVTPDCLNPSGERTPSSAGGGCPAGSNTEFQPVKDIHIGVVSSSLGDPTCGDPRDRDDALEMEQRSDRGHLLGNMPRFESKAGAPGLDPVTPEGFLDWNPQQKAGQTDTAFKSTFTLMTKATGEIGCGYEAQLESFYRFLVDPAPPASYRDVPCGNGQCKARVGIDEPLLRQRKAFLRPDSLVAVILLTDENDCSIRDTGQGYLATQDIFQIDGKGGIQSGSAMCATNPNDRCCYPCNTVPPKDCSPDPTCAERSPPPLQADDPNLRCFDQKRRFGYDYLFPTARYVNALKQPRLCISRDTLDGVEPPQNCPDNDGDGQPDIRDNPLYLSATQAAPRSSDLVFFAGILGVPWQDIQATKDLKGKDYPADELHYMSATELGAAAVWDTILGDPHPPNDARPIPPKNNLMVESFGVRGGTDGQGRPLGAPGGPANANPINGHEWNIADDKDGPADLQYACVFPMPPNANGEAFRRCDQPNPDGSPLQSCDCDDRQAGDNNPLCQDPVSHDYGTGKTQFRAKAYPGLRELEVLKGFGKNSIVASICARNVDRPLLQDYGYRPAVDALVERLKEQLSDKCLPRTLRKNSDGKIPCAVVEVLPPGNAAPCDPARGRSAPDDSVVEGVHDRLRGLGQCDVAGQPSCSVFQLCKLEEAGDYCHHDGATAERPGWCYIDPATQPGDDAKLVEKCPSNQQRIVRFVGDNTPAAGADVVFACFGQSSTSPVSSAAAQ